jgi:lamin B
MEQSFEGNTGRLSLSPLTRIQEREQFQDLNERLEMYIEKVKSLKGKNLGLEAEVAALKAEISRSSQKVKDLYEPKLAAVRSLIDKTAKEKARQQLLSQGLEADNRRLETEIDNLEKKQDEFQRRLTSTTQRCNTMEGKYKMSIQERSEVNLRLKEVEKELEELRKQHEKLLKKVEDATVERVDHNNRIMSLTEELTFNKKKNAMELDALRRADSRIALEKTQVVSDVVDQIDGQLDDHIRELKEQSKVECDLLKRELERVYEEKIEQLETQNARDTETIGSLTLEVRTMTEKESTSERDLARLRDQASRLEVHLKQQTEELDRIRREKKEEIGKLLEQIRKLRESYEVKMREYQELFDLKIKLDKEIEKYRKLLEGEEHRLNITPSPAKKRRPPPQTDSPGSASKRPKHHIEKQTVNQANVSSTALDYIHITDVDLNGAYIKLRNTSDQTQSLSSFKLVHTVLDSGLEDVFVFHQRSRLKGGVLVNVWGHRSGMTHNPPTDVVCKHISTWGVGDNTKTELFNTYGETVASYTQRKQHKSSIHFTSDKDDDGGMETDGPSSSSPQEEDDSQEEEQQVTTQGELFHEEEQEPAGDQEQNRRSCTIA